MTAFSRLLKLFAASSPILLIAVAISSTSCERSNRLVVTLEDETPAESVESEVVTEAPVVPESSGAPSNSETPEASSPAEIATGGSLKFDDEKGTLEITGAVFNGFGADVDQSRLAKIKVVRGSGAITLDGLRAFSETPQLVEFLWLDATFPEGDGARDAFQALVASAPKLKKVRLAGLKLQDGAFPQYVLPALAAAPNLQDLDLSGAALATSDLAPFAASGAFPKLAKLTLYQTGVDDQGVETLLPLADRLTWLNLDDTKITPGAAPLVAQFTNLTFLHVGRTTVDDSCVDSFAKLSKLEKIHVTRSNTTEEGADKLRAALPNCVVVSQPEN